jgi:hypothetical protein
MKMTSMIRSRSATPVATQTALARVGCGAAAFAGDPGSGVGAPVDSSSERGDVGSVVMVSPLRILLSGSVVGLSLQVSLADDLRRAPFHEPAAPAVSVFGTAGLISTPDVRDTRVG